MLGPQFTIGRRRGDDGERPFWISYADLMTSLMVLFLVVMLAALLVSLEAVRQAKQETARAVDAKRIALLAENRVKRADARNQVLARKYTKQKQLDAGLELKKKLVREAIRKGLPPGVRLNVDTISFGSRAQFALNRSDLSPRQQQTLRSVVPLLVMVARKQGRHVVQQIVVEGFASSGGTYLHNLNLSLQRSERMVCAILDNSPTAGHALPRPIQIQLGSYCSRRIIIQ